MNVLPRAVVMLWWFVVDRISTYLIFLNLRFSLVSNRIVCPVIYYMIFYDSVFASKLHFRVSLSYRNWPDFFQNRTKNDRKQADMFDFFNTRVIGMISSFWKVSQINCKIFHPLRDACEIRLAIVNILQLAKISFYALSPKKLCRKHSVRYGVPILCLF